MLYLGFEPRATGLEGADDSTELYRLQIFLDIKNWIISGAAIAQWIRLRLPSMLSSIIVFVLYLSREKNENKQKRPGLAHLKKTILV